MSRPFSQSVETRFEDQENHAMPDPSALSETSQAAEACLRECRAITEGMSRAISTSSANSGKAASIASAQSRLDSSFLKGKSCEAGLAAAAGLALGLVSRNYPEAAAALTAATATGFTAANHERLATACSDLRQGLSLALSARNDREQSLAADHFARVARSPLFDLALTGSLAALSAAAGPALFERATFKITDQISPLRGANFAENYFGKRLTRGAYYFTRLGKNGEVEYVAEDASALAPKANGLGLDTEPNLRLERNTTPQQRPLGLGYYVEPFEHPSWRGFPPHERAFQYLEDELKAPSR